MENKQKFCSDFEEELPASDQSESSVTQLISMVYVAIHQHDLFVAQHVLACRDLERSVCIMNDGYTKLFPRAREGQSHPLVGS